MNLLAWVFLGVFATIGGVFTIVGVMIERSDKQFVQNAVAVTVGIIDLHESWSRDSDGTRQRVFAPEFEVMSGPYKGQRFVSKTRSNPPIHQIGDQELGLFDRTTGRIASEKSIGSSKQMGLLFSSMGLGLLCVPLIYLLRSFVL